MDNWSAYFCKRRYDGTMRCRQWTVNRPVTFAVGKPRSKWIICLNAQAIMLLETSATPSKAHVIVIDPIEIETTVKIRVSIGFGIVRVFPFFGRIYPRYCTYLSN